MVDDLQAAILEEGLDDWVQAVQVVAATRLLCPELDEAHALEVVLAAIRGLLERELVVAGDIAGTGFVPFEGSVPDVLANYEAGIRAYLDDPGLGYVWLCNTPRGDEVAARRAQGSQADFLGRAPLPLGDLRSFESTGVQEPPDRGRRSGAGLPNAPTPPGDKR